MSVSNHLTLLIENHVYHSVEQNSFICNFLKFSHIFNYSLNKVEFYIK